MLGNREITVCRELTKKFEEIFRGNTESAIEKFNEEAPRGEFIVVLKGISEQEVDLKEREKWSDLNIIEHLKKMIDSGMSKKEAIKTVAKTRGLPKNEVYQQAIDLE